LTEPLKIYDRWRPLQLTKDGRKCIENLALSLSVTRGEEILNFFADPINKTVKKFLGMNVSEKRFKETLEQISREKAQGD